MDRCAVDRAAVGSEPKAKRQHWQVRALSRRVPAEPHGTHVPVGTVGHLCVGAGTILDERSAREIRTLCSLSGEWKRSRDGVRGTGGMAMDAGIRGRTTLVQRASPRLCNIRQC